MVGRLIQNSYLFILMISISSCHYLEDIESKSQAINNYQKKSYELALENRVLKQKLSDIEYKYSQLENKNSFLLSKLDLRKENQKSRSIASVSKPSIFKDDLVNQDTYKWDATQLLAIGEKEFQNKNYKKSTQFFYNYLEKEESHKTIDDNILFQAGMAAYESSEYYDLAEKYLARIVAQYPTSKYYRSAKLWLGLSKFKMGNKKALYNVVEEFRKKYRNTPEWEILSGIYEDVVQKYRP